MNDSGMPAAAIAAASVDGDAVSKPALLPTASNPHLHE
jgi:hypothetical protein